jgi:HEAT repeat protein
MGVAIVSTLLTSGCSYESVPADQRRRAEAARDEYERQSKVESAESDRKRLEEFQRRIADPGSLSVQESDSLIAALHSPSSLARISAAQKLGDAKGPRAVDPLVAALPTETDPAAFSAIAEALGNIHDLRATDALVAALSAQNMPDDAREHALDAIVGFRSEWRYVPQIQRFYESLTDKSVRARVGQIVERYRK